MSEFLHNSEQRPNPENTPNGDDLIEQSDQLEQDDLGEQSSPSELPQSPLGSMDTMRFPIFSSRPRPEQKRIQEAIEADMKRKLHEPTEEELAKEERYELGNVRDILKKYYWINDLTWQEVRTLREKIRDNMASFRQRRIKYDALSSKIREAKASGVDQETIRELQQELNSIELSSGYVSSNTAGSFIAGLMNIGMADIPLESRVEDMTTGEIFLFPYPHYAIRSKNDFFRSEHEKEYISYRAKKKWLELSAAGHEVDWNGGIPTMEFIGKVHKARHPYD